MAKHTWQDYKTNEDISSELKMKPSCKKNSKLQKKKNGCNMFSRLTDYHTYLWNIKLMGNEAKDDSTKDF